MIPEAILQLRPLFEKYAALHPPLIWTEIAAVAWSESSGNPNAFNPHDPSRGVMQVTPLIAKAYGGVTDQQQLFNPELNIMVGSAFLAHLKETYSAHFPDTWVAGYNEGEGNLTRGVPDPDYVAAFNSHMAELNQLEETAT